MEITFKIPPLTEEQILWVANYFDTWDKGSFTESEIRLNYGRMKAQGVKIDKAEEMLAKTDKRKQESYRWNKEQEINDNLKQYRQQTNGDNGKYSLIKVNEWEDGRCLILWIEWSYDIENSKQRWLHVIEVEERQNPDYFQEIIKRFNLVID